MVATLARWLVRGRWGFFLLALAAVAAVGSGARHLWFESDYKIFFDHDDPQLVAYEAMENAFTRADNVAFVLAPAGGDVFTPEMLAGVHWLTEEAWRLPLAVRVDSLANYQHSEAEGDDLLVSALVHDPEALNAAEAARIRDIALSEPTLVRALVSPQGHVTLVSVRLEMPRDTRAQGEATGEIMAAARALRDAFRERHGDVDVHFMGQIVVNNAFNESATRDSMTLVPVMFLVVGVLLVLFLRSLSATFATIVVINASIVATVGVTGWLGYHVNQVNVSAPIIILTLAVSDCVHVLLSYFGALRRGEARPAAMEEALRINLPPVFLTSVTTAIGFFSLNFSDSPPFRELGNSVGVGVIGAMLWTVMILPALMSVLPVRVKADGTGQSTRFVRMADWVLRHHRAILWGTLATALLVASQMVRNDLNDDTVEYFHKGTEMRTAFDFVADHLTGTDTITYALPAGEENGIYDPGYLRRVDAFAQWYRTQPEVTHVTTFTDVVKRLNRNMNEGDPDYYRIPDGRELAAQYVLLYELSLPMGLDLNDLVTFDKSATRFHVNIDNVRARELIALEERAQAWLAENAPDIASHGSSVSLMFAHIGQNNIRSMIRGSVVALVLIALTLIIALRSFKFGLLSLLPNAFPAAIAFGVWGMTMGQVNLAVAAVFAISLGIVVDNTVHFFSKYLHARRDKGLDAADAIRYAYGVVAAALTVTAAALALGFSVLAWSDFAVNSSMGLMTAMTIVFALVFDLLFLPGLLMRFDRERHVIA